MSKKIAVIGGDMRQLAMAEHMAKDGLNVVVYGFRKELLWSGAGYALSLADALCGSKFIVLGLPAATDDCINAPCYDEKIYLSDFFDSICGVPTVIGGRISEKFRQMCSENYINVIDYFAREDLTILNTIPTAEGAVEIAMRELPYTIHGLPCLVTGFGRVGKTLALTLKNLGARVACSARKNEDTAWIKTLGLRPLKSSDLEDYIHEYTAVFNTVPSKIFTRDVLRNVRSDAIIIDLSSKPGGVDMDAAKELNIKVIWALSLPGKVAPVTAGKIIKDTVLNIINEF